MYGLGEKGGGLDNLTQKRSFPNSFVLQALLEGMNSNIKTSKYGIFPDYHTPLACQDDLDTDCTG